MICTVLRGHSNVLWFHVSKVGFLPFTHKVKMQRAITEGAGSCGRAVESESDFSPNLDQRVFGKIKTINLIRLLNTNGTVKINNNIHPLVIALIHVVICTHCGK